jgi:acetyl esterase/lipase
MADSCLIPDEIEQLADISFTNDGEPSLKLDLYRLRGVRFRESRPVVVWLHGGGWMSGDRERGVERIFGLVRAGFIGASLDYRLSQDALFPAQLHDCKCAVRFLRANASKYDIDTERVGVWGASAGGHLASLLAVTDRERSLEGSRGWETFSSRIQAACSWFGPSDLNVSGQFPPGVMPRFPNLSADSAEGRLVGGPVTERQELVSMANPIRYIHPGSPPILLMHGAKDDTVPLASSERFHEQLVARGVSAHLHVLKNGHHNAYLWGDHHLQLVNEFFEWHLREPAL